MKKSDFYYDLPEELIAQHPVERRDSSRLLVLNRETGETEHRRFYEITEFLTPGDCLILNDTRVLPARLWGTRADTGTRVEFLLLNRLEDDVWEALAGPSRRAGEGKVFNFGAELNARVVGVLDNGSRLLKFTYDGIFLSILERIGEMPLPHYIKEKLADSERYQTVYSRENGSAAAPTAGLHFTPELLDRIRASGVATGFVTLHVGIGTFRPVKTENIEEHRMHSEFYNMPAETARLINLTKKNGGRVIAVGTTSCRTLESVARDLGEIREHAASTDIFIYPGCEFKCVDALITNFHLPESTLIMLVSAFCGRENTLRAYREAVRERYRFFSFGDAMLII